MAEITIKGRIPDDPRKRVLAIEAAAKAVCQSAGEDPADAIMALMVAAVHMTMQHTDKPISEASLVMAKSLGHAIVAADDFFTLRKV
ncbi:hypothetical protein [Pelagibacterium lentulum]|uniref:Uncharacterized protein n=1 Tax=Pelagibacterium lentulum TaxID=2029865 RepID=A0A916VWQ9_9HYPH|nr:hypothetical protein [Pelagibacterium lentulum]GGA45857.1 hypothetical protein GCM10011499_14500 [Pelagibacterium lentulum]